MAGDAQKSSSHFHCLKCDYYCTDTNKVVAHRRQHQKLDSIMAAGFEKYTPTQFCPVGGCPHNGKQTHYHCSKCQYAVLGLSQMEGHKYRHMNEQCQTVIKVNYQPQRQSIWTIIVNLYMPCTTFFFIGKNYSKTHPN